MLEIALAVHSRQYAADRRVRGAVLTRKER